MTQKDEPVSASHVEDLKEAKLEAGEALAEQQREHARAMNSRVVRKVCSVS